MNWKDYEIEIFEDFKEAYPNAEVSHNVLRKGRYSKVDRQIDILVEDYVAGNRITIVVDGKFYNKNIDVKEVETFISMLEDLDAHKGLLITQKGYSQAAINRAHYGPSDIELDILNFEELKAFQGFGAIPYSGDNGALIPAPFGWIIDAQASPAGLATLYQRGQTLDEAMGRNEFMYVQFWDRRQTNDNLEDLLKLQERNYLEAKLEPKIEYKPTIKRNDAKTKLRIANLKNYPCPEYTGFIEFEDFIFFCVLFSPIELSQKNLKKLENLLAKAIPIKIKNKANALINKT